LVKSGIDKNAILVEKDAHERGTYDNAFNSRAVTDALGLTIKTAIICCKPFHARRCLMSYAWAYRDTKLLVCPAELESQKNTNRENWFNNSDGIERIMSELKKCGQYFVEAIPIIS